jgi:heat shock protein HslJ
MSNSYQNPGDAIVTLDTHKWYLTTIYKPDGYTQVLIRKAFISFQTDNGKIAGNGSCNSFGGRLTVDGENLSFGNIFSTKMYCNDVQSIEDDFFRKLQKVTRYEIKGKCLLLFNGDKLLLELV